ncbi:glutathione S-transferase family member gst-3 [Aphelenchoides avenae]|nr:glutathione S-transferase family member gst-3 [Aphelenchus avenae]
MPEEYTLYAINSRYRPRAEPHRMMFHYAKMPFKDVHVSGEEFSATLDKMPLRQLPTLEVKSNGKSFMNGQTTAILCFQARKFGLEPQEDPDKAFCDMYGEQVQDLADHVAQWQLRLYTQSATELEAEFFKGKVVALANRIGKLFGTVIGSNPSGFVVGSKVTWVDIFLAELVDKLYAFHKRDDLFKDYPTIEQHHRKVYALPELQEYVDNRADFAW